MSDPTLAMRIPVPLMTAFGRMRLDVSANPEEALSRVRIQPHALQDFRSLTQSLEWELSELHWNRAGLLPFVESDVPFIINNTGRLSEHAAAVLFANCTDFDDGGPITVLELGAGTTDGYRLTRAHARFGRGGVQRPRWSSPYEGEQVGIQR